MGEQSENEKRQRQRPTGEIVELEIFKRRKKEKNTLRRRAREPLKGEVFLFLCLVVEDEVPCSSMLFFLFFFVSFLLSFSCWCVSTNAQTEEQNVVFSLEENDQRMECWLSSHLARRRQEKHRLESTREQGKRVLLRPSQVDRHRTRVLMRSSLFLSFVFPAFIWQRRALCFFFLCFRLLDLNRRTSQDSLRRTKSALTTIESVFVCLFRFLGSSALFSCSTSNLFVSRLFSSHRFASLSVHQDRSTIFSRRIFFTPRWTSRQSKYSNDQAQFSIRLIDQRSRKVLFTETKRQDVWLSTGSNERDDVAESCRKKILFLLLIGMKFSSTVSRPRKIFFSVRSSLCFSLSVKQADWKQDKFQGFRSLFCLVLIRAKQMVDCWSTICRIQRDKFNISPRWFDFLVKFSATFSSRMIDKETFV